MSKYSIAGAIVPFNQKLTGCMSIPTEVYTNCTVFVIALTSFFSAISTDFLCFTLFDFDIFGTIQDMKNRMLLSRMFECIVTYFNKRENICKMGTKNYLVFAS